MAGAADTEQLNVNAPQSVNLLLIVGAVGLYFIHGKGSVRDMDVFFFNIDEVEKILLHKADVALLSIGLHRVIFIQVEGDDVVETQSFLPMHAHQFVVHLNGRGTGSQPQHNFFAFLLSLANSQSDRLGDMPASLHRGVPDFNREFFQGFELIT